MDPYSPANPLSPLNPFGINYLFKDTSTGTEEPSVPTPCDVQCAADRQLGDGIGLILGLLVIMFLVGLVLWVTGAMKFGDK